MPTLRWTGCDVDRGEVFRIGADVGIREGPSTLRIASQTTPDAPYRAAAITAIAELGTRWGGPVELVLDFVGTGPPGPGESLQLVRSLAASGTVSRIVFIQKPWMPGVLVSSVTGVLRSAGLPIALRREGA